MIGALLFVVVGPVLVIAFAAAVIAALAALAVLPPPLLCIAFVVWVDAVVASGNRVSTGAGQWPCTR